MFGLQPKALLHIEGAVVLLLSCILYHQFHGNWLLFVLLLLTPDLFMLGYGLKYPSGFRDTHLDKV